MNYYQKCEEIGNQLFTKWAEKVGCFISMERQDLFSRCDWICQSKKGSKVNCELKVRDTLQYPTIFIEPNKYKYLIDKWNIENIIPWYINMCEDTVLVFDLRVVKPIRSTTVKIWSKPDQQYKIVERYELPTDKAFKFKDGVLIK